MTVIVASLALLAGIWFANRSSSDFSTLSGQKYSWQGLKGQWVVVNYFAEWCKPCLEEIPELNQFAQFAEQQPEIAFFAISYDPITAEQLTGLKQKYAMDFALIVTQPEQSPVAKPEYLPATFIIGPDGNVKKQLFGKVSNQNLQSMLRQLSQ